MPSLILNNQMKIQYKKVEVKEITIKVTSESSPANNQVERTIPIFPIVYLEQLVTRSMTEEENRGVAILVMI